MFTNFSLTIVYFSIELNTKLAGRWELINPPKKEFKMITRGKRSNNKTHFSKLKEPTKLKTAVVILQLVLVLFEIIKDLFSLLFR